MREEGQEGKARQGKRKILHSVVLGRLDHSLCNTGFAALVSVSSPVQQNLAAALLWHYTANGQACELLTATDTESEQTASK